MKGVELGTLFRAGRAGAAAPTLIYFRFVIVHSRSIITSILHIVLATKNVAQQLLKREGMVVS